MDFQTESLTVLKEQLPFLIMIRKSGDFEEIIICSDPLHFHYCDCSVFAAVE